MAGQLRPLPAKQVKPPTLAERMETAQRRRVVTGFQWHMVDSRLVMCALAVTQQAGGAIQFGSSMGGKGLTGKLFLNGEKLTEYFSLPDELEEWLNYVIDLLASGAEDPRESFQVGVKGTGD